MVKKKKHVVSVKTQFMVAIGSVLLLMALGFVVIWADSSSSWKLVKKTPSFADVTVKGEPGCLPHRESDGPETLECAQGIKTASGSYYAIAGVLDERNKDGTIEVTGTLTPPRDDSKYDVTGIIVLE